MRLGPAGRLVGTASVLAAAGLPLPLWPWLLPPLLGAWVVLLALVLWDALLLHRRPLLAVSRSLPDRAWVGREARLALVVENGAPTPVLVDVLDELPLDLAARDPEHADVLVPAGGRAVLPVVVVPERRGDRPLGRPVLRERSPLGLLERRVVGGEGVLRVHPDVRRHLRPEALDPRRVLAALGVRPQRPRGEGLEFESLRDWVPGDDPRHVDWAASARRGRPVVRLHQHERSHTVLLAVDAGRLMAARARGRSKLDHAVDAALTLAFTALGTGDRVGLVVFDADLRCELLPRGRRSDLGDFVETLRTVEPRLVESDPAALVRHLALRRAQRALVVVLTDFAEAAAARLAPPLTVLARRHQVLLVALRDPLFDALEAPAEPTPESVARRIVLDDLLREREAALGALRRHGLDTLDLLPERVTPALLNRYLALRFGAGR